jgi:hypothetical protein
MQRAKAERWPQKDAKRFKKRSLRGAAPEHTNTNSNSDPEPKEAQIRH